MLASIKTAFAIAHIVASAAAPMTDRVEFDTLPSGAEIMIVTEDTIVGESTIELDPALYCGADHPSDELSPAELRAVLEDCDAN